ncbi:hypothetical protein M8J76_016613 [Diaphorina citri]|nr:hypothetical protein M8J76_016613 [Diaphorina citri]
MSNSNHIDSLKKLDTNVIKTEAIIEHNHTRKRSLENGDTECTPTKKSRQKDQPKTSTQPIKLTSIENESQVQETPSSKNKESSKHTDLDNAIVVHPNSPVSNDRVTVFEDQFKKKLNSLNKEYSALIDITKVKIKKENESSNNRKSLADTNNSISADNETVCNDSSDESDIVVLGPGPPKQFDVITLNENGEEIRERIDNETKSNAEREEYEESEHEIEPDGSEVMNCEGDNPVEGKEQRGQDEEEDGETENNMCAYPKKWTQEMINFYTEDVNPDRFKQRIQAQLNKSRPDQWRIDYHTSYRFNDVQYGYNKMCENCGSRMHDLKSCPKPCFSVCPMCGETGHAPDRCPDAHCLNCGKKTDEYLFNCEECDQKVVLKIKCDVCHRLYHTNDLCPHLWRSMEFTTRKGKLKVLPMSAGPSSNTKYCSNCAGRGHLIAECPHLSTEHPLRQDSTWKVLSEAHATYLVHHKLKVTRRVSKVLLSKQGMAELQKLSNESGVTIEYLVDEGVNILSYKSNPVQSHYIRSQLKKFLFPS